MRGDAETCCKAKRASARLYHGFSIVSMLKEFAKRR